MGGVVLIYASRNVMTMEVVKLYWWDADYPKLLYIIYNNHKMWWWLPSTALYIIYNQP